VIEVACAQEEEKPEDETSELNCQSTLSFRNGLICNFFIMFFYEASLEISISLAIGVKYIWEN